jgi:hypothetical protein
MDKKNLTSPANDSVISITGQDLSAELAELSEEVLSQVRGGVLHYLEPKRPVPCCTVYPPDWNPDYPFTVTVFKTLYLD